MNEVTSLCRTIPDYPEEGINFYDLNSVFASNAFHVMVEKLARRLERDSDIQHPTHVVGVESRGFVLGSAIAQEMMLPFVMIRKQNSKYPGKTRSQSYELEYGTNTLELQEGILGHTSRVIIVDDLVATGGSLLASQNLCEDFGATVLAGAYSLAGGPKYVAETILAYDLKPMYLIFMMQIMFLIMGAFMDWVGIVLLAMPVFLPIVIALGFDPIWFGILFCVNMQVSFLSPPFGPAAFYLKSVAPPHISLTDIFRGFAPFIVIQLIVLACVMFFPEAMTQNFHEFKPKP